MSLAAPLPAAAADDVRVFATISTQNGTSPAFECSAAAGLAFRPLAAPRAAVQSLGGGKCQLTGASAVGGSAAKDKGLQCKRGSQPDVGGDGGSGCVRHRVDARGPGP